MSNIQHWVSVSVAAAARSSPLLPSIEKAYGWDLKRRNCFSTFFKRGGIFLQWKDAKLHISCELIDKCSGRPRALTALRSGLGQTFLENWNCKAELRIQSELHLEHFLMLNLLRPKVFSIFNLKTSFLGKANDKMKLQLLQVLKYDKNSWIVGSRASLKWI